MDAVLLLISGASCAGKTSVREAIAADIEPAVAAIELRHLAFADWMRRHVRDPGYTTHVLSIDGWQEMR